MRVLVTIFFSLLYLFTSAQMPNEDTHLDLRGLKLKSIPDSVFLKTTTTQLDFGSKSITFFPPMSALTDEQSNELTSIPEAISKLSNLEVLILNTNKLKTLPKSIVALKKLRVLDLSLNKDFDVIKELETLRQLKSLKVLKIVYVKGSKANLDIITKALPEVEVIISIPEYLNSIR